MYLLWELYEYTKYLITCLQYHKKLIFSRSFQKLNKSILGQQRREATDAGAGLALRSRPSGPGP